MKQKLSYLSLTWQANKRNNPKRRWIRDPFILTFSSLTKCYANNYNIYTKNVMYTYVGAVYAASISVSSYLPCLVNSVAHVLPLSSIPSAYCSIPTPSSMGFPELCWEGFDGDLKFRLCLCNGWLYVEYLCTCSPMMTEQASQLTN